MKKLMTAKIRLEGETVVKNREYIPRAIRDNVLKEFNHRCAMCGTDNPHIHHIDGDPTNNDELNLIPLCPNCHLQDHHAPTRSIDPKILALFRKYKDPTILTPHFFPLFRRLEFLDVIDEISDVDELEKGANELLDFIEALEMGNFYSKKLGELIRKPRRAYVRVLGDLESERVYRKVIEHDNKEYHELLTANRDAVISLVVELLQFQQWSAQD